MKGGAVSEAAELNPEQKYACIDAFFPEPTDNLIGVLFKEQEPSFLVGYIAGKMTETNKVGFVGGVAFDVIFRFEYGFRAGVKYANPDCEVDVQYAGDFNDIAKGKAIANQMYANGADIVFHAAGSTGIGVIEAAQENDKWVIGVDQDQNHLAPDNVITSAMKRVDNAIFNVLEALAKDEFEGGQNITYGLAEGGVDIAPSSDKLVPADILEEVDELKQMIIDGDIVVPGTQEEFEAQQ